jgi:hypothetical protein
VFVSLDQSVSPASVPGWNRALASSRNVWLLDKVSVSLYTVSVVRGSPTGDVIAVAKPAAQEARVRLMEARRLRAGRDGP